MANQFDFNLMLAAVKAEAEVIITTIRYKGAKRFMNAFGMSAILVAGAYFGIYKPPQNKISRLQKEIDAAKAMSDAASSYTDLRTQLAGSYGSLPHIQDQAQWLSNAMIDSLRADSLTPEMFRPVTESESSGLIFQTSTVQLSLKFNEMYMWLLRLESANPLMHVYSLEMTKKQETVGVNSLTATVMTAIPKMRFD